jgi:anti-sigma regulatory factor (Ser/Thr protein kinase)
MPLNMRDTEELRSVAGNTTTTIANGRQHSEQGSGLRPQGVTMPAEPAERANFVFQGWDGTTVQPDVELVLPALPENVAVVRHVFAGVGDVLGMDSSSLGRLRLALSEACTNVVVHAYDEDKRGTLEVDAIIEDRLLNVVVRDRGVGVRPRPDSPGLGMGLPLIAAVTDEVEIVGNEQRGNEVRMTFLLPATGDAAAEAS